MYKSITPLLIIYSDLPNSKKKPMKRASSKDYDI